MHRAKWVFVGVFLLAAAPLFAQATVAGDWEVTINSPQGATTATASLKQDGDKVSGVLKNPMGELPFEGGTLTGDELKFVFTVNFQGTPIPITLTGKVKDAAIDGKADFGGMAEGDWTAKRIDPAAAANTAAPSTAPAASASATGAAGKWDVTFKTPQGDFPAIATLTSDGSKLTGTVGSALGEAPVSGTLDGMSVSLTLVVNNPQGGGTMNVSMTGQLQGDTMTGMADVSGMGQMEWSARRSKQ